MYCSYFGRAKENGYKKKEFSAFKNIFIFTISEKFLKKISSSFVVKEHILLVSRIMNVRDMLIVTCRASSFNWRNSFIKIQNRVNCFKI